MKGLIRICGKGLNICVAAIFSLTILVGCVTKEARKDISDEEALRQRIMAYWNHKIKQEFDKSYEYEYPIKGITRSRYISRLDSPLIRYKDFSIKSIIKLSDDTAEVEMDILPVLKAPGAKPFEHKTTIKEKWVKWNGLWYHVFQKDFPAQ